MNTLTLDRPAPGFTFMRSQKQLGGRPLKGAERLSERLAPIYVTPTFKLRLDETLKQYNWDFAEFGREALAAKLDNASSNEDSPGQITIEIPENEIERMEAISDQSVRTRDLSRFAEQLVRSMLDYDAATVRRIVSGQIAADLSAYEQLKAQIANQSAQAQENISPPPMLSPKDEERKINVDKIYKSHQEIGHTKEETPAKRKAS